ncbi:MAG TPA: AraC family transcriptional regulator [Allosphingosinicella sp.]|jgi:AraC family transcriptional regulator
MTPATRWVSAIGARRYAPSSRLPAHHHDEPVLCLVLAGRYLDRIRGAETEHRAGHLLYCPAFEPHAQTFRAGGALKLLMRPTAAALDFLADGVRLEEAPFVRGGRLRAIGIQLAAELKAPDGCSAMIVEGLVGELLGLLGRSAQDAECRGGRAVSAALDIIAQRACGALTLAEIAAAVGADPVRLSAAFRRALGKTIGECIRQKRLEQAAERLSRSRTPIAAISSECGFYDQAHLTRAFRAAYGVTPARFRSAVQ